MALKQVRVKLGDAWTVLSYNSATGRYEGTITAPGTSYHQPGGYYSLTAEVTNDSGGTDSITGAQLPALRLGVRETTAPVLTLVSPPPGWLTTQSPTFVFRAQDETGGSGIDPATATVAVDGAQRPCTVTQSGEVYTVTCAVGGLQEGSHTVTAAISDHDGNQSTASAAYTVDTVPPTLTILQPLLRHVVDVDSVEIVAEAWDGNGVEVSVEAPSVSLRSTAPPEGGAEALASPFRGRWLAGGQTERAFTVPLEVGENRITVTAADPAGNTTTAEVYMIRLITDRTQADLEKVREMQVRGMEAWSAEELAWYNNAVVRGAYNVEDWNRVGVAVDWLAGELRRHGYDPSVSPKTDWTQDDAPQWSQMLRYLADVVTIRDAQGLDSLDALPLPDTIRHLSLAGANQIEEALVEVDAVFPRYSYWTAGELTAGEC